MRRMQKPLRTGLYTFFLRYSRFSLNSLHKAIFNELFLFQQSPDVAFKRNIGIRLCDARNEKNETWFPYRVRVRAKRFAQQSFDPIAHDALPVFFSDADRKFRPIARDPDDGKALRVRPFPCPQDLGKILFFLDPQDLHRGVTRKCAFCPYFFFSLRYFCRPWSSCAGGNRVPYFSDASWAGKFSS